MIMVVTVAYMLDAAAATVHGEFAKKELCRRSGKRDCPVRDNDVCPRVESMLWTTEMAIFIHPFTDSLV